VQVVLDILENREHAREGVGMTDIQQILARIEHLRQLLHVLVAKGGGNLNDEAVLCLSEELDCWIVRYTQSVGRSSDTTDSRMSCDRK